MKMIGMFGSYVATAESGGISVGTDLVDLIYEQERLRFPNSTMSRETFGLVNLNLVAPSGTVVKLNNSEYCKVLITDTKTLVIPPEYMVVNSCILESDCASVNCRYLY